MKFVGSHVGEQELYREWRESELGATEREKEIKNVRIKRFEKNLCLLDTKY